MTHDLRSGSATTVLAPNHAIPLSISLSLVFPRGVIFSSQLFVLDVLRFQRHRNPLNNRQEKENEKLTPKLTGSITLLWTSFVLSLLYTIPPIHQAYQPLYPIDFNPIPSTSLCSTSRTGQEAKKASEKKYHTMFLYVYIQLIHNPHMIIICKCL